MEWTFSNTLIFANTIIYGIIAYYCLKNFNKVSDLEYKVNSLVCDVDLLKTNSLGGWEKDQVREDHKTLATDTVRRLEYQQHLHGLDVRIIKLEEKNKACGL